MYIGSTTNVYDRIRTHARTYQFDAVLVHRCYTIEEAQEKEQRLIGFEKPSWKKRLLHKKRPRVEKVIPLLTEL